MPWLSDLHHALAAVAPIDGVSIDTEENVTVHFLPDATDTQKQAANDILASFDRRNVVVPSFVARDLLDLLTTADLAAIKATVALDVNLDLLWTRMTGRGDKPISTDSPDFAAGWAGLTAALGQSRADEISKALGAI